MHQTAEKRQETVPDIADVRHLIDDNDINKDKLIALCGEEMDFVDPIGYQPAKICPMCADIAYGEEVDVK